MKELSIEKEINDSVKEKREERKVTSWQASKLGTCLTGVYLERLGVPPDEDFTDNILCMFSLGHKYEDWVAENLAKRHKVERQPRIEWPEYDLTGYGDILLDDELVVEVKSASSVDVIKMLKGERTAKVHNQMQLWVALKVLDKEEGRLIYVSRKAKAEYPVLKKDRWLESKVRNELEILNKAWSEKVAPPMQYENNKWQAKFCRWHKQCLSQ